MASYIDIFKAVRNQKLGILPNDPLGGGGSGGLRDIVRQYFLPQLERLRGQSGISDAFLGQVQEPGALFGAASEAASGTARQLFAPGGEVATMIGRARGQSINQGFNPEAAAGGENEILRGATQRVADTFATQAGGLEQTRIGALSQAYGLREQQMMELIESIFTGVGSAEQLNLAKNPPRRKFLGIF